MNNAEKRNIEHQLYLMESNLIHILTQINTLYGFLGRDVKVTIRKEDFGLIDKSDKEEAAKIKVETEGIEPS